jgi:5-methylcytosine-specific restriction protein A
MLLNIVLETATHSPASRTVTAKVFERSAKVRNDVRLIARGYCEGCCKRAPFVGSDGQPFLEVHHVDPLAAGGFDSIESVIALCPNCHRKAHLAKDATTFNKRLRAIAKQRVKL